MEHLFARLARILILLLGTGLWITCGGSSEDRQTQNVLLITVDTLRADALGFMGNADTATPVLDRLAATGKVFDNAHAHSTVTLPSHANILTGRYPFRHGVRDNLGFTLGDDQTTLAEALSAEGFVTGAFIAAYPLHSRFNLDQGFAVYDDPIPANHPENPFLLPERPGDEVVERALAWWNANRDSRRFLWVHLFEPHAPYFPPEPFRSQHAGKPYLAEVATADSFLAPLLEPLLDAREENRTLVVFTSDHGEGLGDHGELTHGFFAYESTLKVPLVLWGPGIESGRESTLARHVDLMPTILEAVGSTQSINSDGVSLLSAGDSEWTPVDSYFESLTAHLTRGWAPLRGLIRHGDKAIEQPIPELYDLEEDPGETQNLAAGSLERFRDLQIDLPEEAEWPPKRGEVSREVEDQLRALGYLGGSPAGDRTYSADDDLKNLVHLDRKLLRAHMLFSRGRYQEAARLAAAVLEERADFSNAYEYLALSLANLGRTPEAVTVMRRGYASGVTGPTLVNQLALILVARGEAETAIPLVEERISTAGAREIETLLTLSTALLATARVEEAAVILQEILEIEPDQLDALLNLGIAAADLGQDRRSREVLERFLEMAPAERYRAKIEAAEQMLESLAG